jgi:branched-chain amino acid transport system permease protein
MRLRYSPLTLGIVGLAIAAVALLPLISPSLTTLFALVLAKGIVVLGIIILLQAGQVSFGHAMFFGAGAYAVAFWGKYLGPGDMVLYLVLGTVAGALFGLVVGLFVVRYRQIFFGMLNLAFSMVLWSLLEKMFHITNGADGIRVPRPTMFGLTMTPDGFSYAILYLTLALALVTMLLVQRYLASPLGHMLRAIKSNETRLEYLGVSARRVLLIGYVISAALAGLGGSLVAVVQQIATPEFAYWTKSGEFVFIAILGGAGNALGAFAGSLVFEFVRFYASAQLADAWQLILGIVLIAIILFAPSGLIGLIRAKRAAAEGKTV